MMEGRPEAVGEGLYGKLGDAVSTAVGSDPTQDRCYVHDPAPGQLDKRQEGHGHGYHSIQIDVQRFVEVLHFHPLCGAHRQRVPCIVHNAP